MKMAQRRPTGGTSSKTRNSLPPFSKRSNTIMIFGLLLRDSEYRGEATYEQVLELAREARGSDMEGYRAEFVKLVRICKSLGD